VDATSAASLMADHPSAMKRPVVVWPDGALTVGFDDQIWLQRLADCKVALP
jgi:arsenate reductase-like glutaredoxin family protein